MSFIDNTMQNTAQDSILLGELQGGHKVWLNLNGKFGPYLRTSYPNGEKKNYGVPKNVLDPKLMSLKSVKSYIDFRIKNI